MTEHEGPGPWTRKDEARLRDIRRDYFLRLIQIEWSSMSKRERKRLARTDQTLAIAIRLLVEEHLIP